MLKGFSAERSRGRRVRECPAASSIAAESTPADRSHLLSLEPPRLWHKRRLEGIRCEPIPTPTTATW
jgi:hypothetical protein